MRAWVAFSVFTSFFFLVLSITGPWQLRMSNGSVAVIRLPWQSVVSPVADAPSPNPSEAVESQVGVPAPVVPATEPVVSVTSDRKVITDVPAEVQYTQGSGAVAIKCRNSDGRITYVQGSCPLGFWYVASVSGADMNGADFSGYKQETQTRAAMDAEVAARDAQVASQRLATSGDAALRDQQCANLGAAKHANEVQRRYGSNSAMIQQHTQIIRQMDDLHCPAHFF